MKFCSIASGSSGNCIYAGSSETSVLIDAGISGKRIEQGLNSIEQSTLDINGILVTHEHSDHIKVLGVLARRYGIPVYGTKGTLDALKEMTSIGKLPETLLHTVKADDPFSIGDLEIHPFTISHDAAEPVGYRISHNGRCCAVATDMGCYDEYMVKELTGLDVLLLESNHDVVMLKNGGYPYYLKQRILSEYGHLSNDAAAEFAIECVRAGTSDILLAHLSDENNSPQLAEYTVGRALQSSGLSVRLAAAPRDTISEVHVCRRSPSFASEN